MLIQFQIENFRSFREEATFNMLASKLTSRSAELDEGTVREPKPGLRLVTSAAIYGANASGKSNLVLALAFMSWFVANSARELHRSDRIPVDLFKLRERPTRKTAKFEVVFLCGQTEYRYGFAADERRVAQEWLFAREKTRERTLFTRDGATFELGPSFRREGQGLPEKTRDNALFLTVVAQFNGTVAGEISTWFRSINLVSGVHDLSARLHTIERIRDARERGLALELLRRFDLGIEGLELEHRPPADAPTTLPEEMRTMLLSHSAGQDVVKTVHRAFKADGRPGKEVRFDLDDESQGTQKLFALAGPLLEALRGPRLLVIDEFDARLHPILSRMIIQLFNSRASNPHHAQLVIATHDTSVLHKDMFRRDQIWFTEKDKGANSHLYSLAEFKVRNDASFAKDYIQGLYGAVPFIRRDGLFEDLLVTEPNLDKDRRPHAKTKTKSSKS